MFVGRLFVVLSAVATAVASGDTSLRGAELPAKAGYKNYRGHQLHRVFVDDEDVRRELKQELEGTADVSDWDVWEDHIDATDVRVSPEDMSAFEEMLARRKLKSKTLMSDVFNHCDGHIRDAHAEQVLPEWDTSDDFFDDYRVLSDMYLFIKRLAQQHSNSARVVHLGQSTEGRDILGIEMTANLGKWGQGGRKGILIAGGVHCREWVAHTTALFIAERLLEGAAPKIFEDYDWTIVPNLNPDGYKYTWERDRFWRKTRSKDADCEDGFSADPMSSPMHSNMGADANRNWGYHWKDTGNRGYEELMGQPCSNVYAGHGAFSEPEPRALARYMKTHSNLIAYIDFHSYAQALLPPWGYKSELPMDSPAQGALCEAMVAAAHKANRHRQYRWGPNIFPSDPGTSPDYAYGEEGIVATMTIELPDTGTHGFCLPRSEIVPVGKEQLAMIKAMAQHIGDNNAFNRRADGGEGEGGQLKVSDLH